MNEKEKKEFKRLEMNAKDCGVHFGIYSKEYADAIHKMNDYWKAHREISTRELFKITKYKVSRWIQRNC